MNRRTCLLIALGIVLASALGMYGIKSLNAYRNHQALLAYGKYPNPRPYSEYLQAFETHPEERYQRLENVASTPYFAVKREELFSRTLLRSPLPMPESIEDKEAFNNIKMFHGFYAEVKEVNSVYAILLVEGRYLVAGTMPMHKISLLNPTDPKTDFDISTLQAGDSGYMVFELKENRFGWNLLTGANK